MESEPIWSRVTISKYVLGIIWHLPFVSMNVSGSCMFWLRRHVVQGCYGTEKFWCGNIVVPWKFCHGDFSTLLKFWHWDISAFEPLGWNVHSWSQLQFEIKCDFKNFLAILWVLYIKIFWFMAFFPCYLAFIFSDWWMKKCISNCNFKIATF